MFYVTGDTHGTYDIKKLLRFEAGNGKELTKDDYVVICGDFGFVWENREDEAERYWLDYINNFPWTTLFVDGNHENFTALYNRFKFEEWKGGRVQFLRDSVIHLMRGQVFNIDGKKIFAMGGARSVDRGVYTKTEYADRGVNWWDEEMPSSFEYAEAKKNLRANDNTVDYIFTHDIPANTLYELSHGLYKPNELNYFLEELLGNVSYEKWYAGHYHMDRKFRDVRIIYDDVLNINDRRANELLQN